eukprot:Lithocolla_globosa_v1_NODE_1652_length_2417_cov_35.469094.p4 type:complete len:144 gc:universal NODE_1652_length_2417_cov_35.469094:633-1064(+)
MADFLPLISIRALPPLAIQIMTILAAAVAVTEMTLILTATATVTMMITTVLLLPGMMIALMIMIAGTMSAEMIEIATKIVMTTAANATRWGREPTQGVPQLQGMTTPWTAPKILVEGGTEDVIDAEKEMIATMTATWLCLLSL